MWGAHGHDQTSSQELVHLAKSKGPHLLSWWGGLLSFPYFHIFGPFRKLWPIGLHLNLGHNFFSLLLKTAKILESLLKLKLLCANIIKIHAILNLPLCSDLIFYDTSPYDIENCPLWTFNQILITYGFSFFKQPLRTQNPWKCTWF